MKTVPSVIFLSFLFIFLLVTPVIGSSDWVEYGRSIYGSVFLYNKVKVKHITKDIVQVWDKEVYSDEGKREYIQKRRKDNLSTEGYDKLSYRLDLVEIDCKKETVRYLLISENDTDGNLLDIFLYDNPDWNRLIPDIIDDTLQKKVCSVLSDVAKEATAVEGKKLKDQTEEISPATPPKASKNGKYAIQIRAYPEARIKDAMVFAKDLRKTQPDVYVERVNIRKRGVRYRILMGHFTSIEDAKNYMKEKKILEAYPGSFVQSISEGQSPKTKPE